MECDSPVIYRKQQESVLMNRPTTLLVNDVPAITLSNQTLHQGTWIAAYKQVDGSKGAESRITSFVEFCVEWSERADRGEDPDPAEFDRFEELMGRWSADFEDGSNKAIEGAPTFDEHEASFVTQD